MPMNLPPPRQCLSVRLCLLLCACLAGSAPAAHLELKDGRKLEGELRLKDNALILESPGAPSRTIALAELRQAFWQPQHNELPRPSFKAPAPKRSGAPQEPQGLLAEYFADPDFRDLKLARIEPQVEYWWFDRRPDPSLPQPFSARWTGQLTPEFSETYTFLAHINDLARLWVDGKLIIDHWEGKPGSFTGSIALQAGRKYNLKLEHRSHVRGGNILLSWSSPRQKQQIIPPERLTPPPGTLPPAVSIVTPAEGALLMGRPGNILEASASDRDGTIRRVDFFAQGQLLGTAQAAPWRIEWPDPSSGWHTLTARATDNIGLTALSEPAHAAILETAGGLPPGWGQLPLGTLEPLGSAICVDGEFRLEAKAGNLWEETFHFVGRPQDGDGALVARLRSLEGAGEAGLLIRESLASGKTKPCHAFLGLSSAAGLAFVWREHTWTPRSSIEDAAKAPCYLKLLRVGKLVKAFRSDDGKDWRLLGQRNIEGPRQAFVGLVIASHGEKPARASFDQVQFIPGSPRIVSAVKGVMLRSGSILAGSFRSMDQTSVRISRGKELRIPTRQVARILVQPITEEVEERIPPGRSGAVLANGDFFDGQIENVGGGAITLRSVLFGSQRFGTYDKVIAAVLRDVAEVPWAYEVRATDGSVLRAKGLEIVEDKLLVREACEVLIELSADQIAEIRARP